MEVALQRTHDSLTGLSSSLRQAGVIGSPEVTTLAGLPRFLRQADLIGSPEVTLEQAAANKLAGKGPKRPRAARRGLVPFSSPTLWRKVRAGEFPAPVKLSEGVTAWHADAVLEWMNSKISG